MQARMENLPDGQKWFINSMKRLGYRGSRNGVCHGLATLFMVYCLNNKADSFFRILDFTNENRHLINKEVIDALRARLAKNPQEVLTETEKQLLELANFCETVEILQQPIYYPQLFPNELAIRTQDVEETLSLLGLDTWNNEYTIEELSEQTPEKGKFYAKFTPTGLDYAFINPTGDEIRGTLLAEDLITAFKPSEQHEEQPFKTLNTSFKKVIDLIEKKNGHQINSGYFQKKNIFPAGDVCGVYNNAELEKLIQSFAKIAPEYQPISFSLSACRHAIELTYVNNQWVLFNPSRKFKFFNNEPSSAKEISVLIADTYKSLAKNPKGEYIGLSFTVAVNNKGQALKVKEAMSSIQVNPDIHPTNFGDLRRVDADGKTWDEIAVKTDNLVAMKKIVAGQVEDDDVIHLMLKHLHTAIRNKKREVHDYFIEKLKGYGLQFENLGERDIDTILAAFTSQPLNDFKQFYQLLSPKLSQEPLSHTLERCLVSSILNNNKSVMDYLLDDVYQLKSPDRELKLLQCAVICEKPDLALEQMQKLDALKEEKALTEEQVLAYDGFLKGTFAKHFQSQKPYPMIFLEVNEGVTLKEGQLGKISTQNGNSPILIKQGNTIMIYGLSKENKWQLNPLKNPPSEVMQEIDKLQFGSVGTISPGELHKEIRKNNLHITSTTTLLLSAVKSRNVDLINKLLEKGANLDIPNKQGLTPLMHASRNGFGEIVQILLTKGANSSLIDKKGNSALHYACMEGHTEIAQQLISSNPELINIANNEKITPLMYAVYLQYENVDLIKLLLASKSEANYAVLYLACTKGRLNTVEVLLELAPGVLENNVNLIAAAIKSGNANLVKLLLEPKLPEHKIDYDPLQLFKFACQNRNADIARLIAEKHPDILKSPGAKVPFLNACIAGDLGIVKLFVEKLGSEYIETIEDQNDTGLFFALQRGHKNVAEYLLDSCPNFNDSIKNDPQWLKLITERGHLPLLELFVNKYNVDIKKPDSKGFSAIHHACAGGHVELVKFLVEKDPSVLESRVLDSKTQTPLFLAAGLPDPTVASYLLSKGADIYAVDTALNTPIHLACVSSDSSLSHLLTLRAEDNSEEAIPEIKKMAELRNAKGQTPLMFAIVFDNPSLASLFLECKADINLVDKMGNNALHLLCKSPKDENEEVRFLKDTIKIVLHENKELLNTINGAGMTPLMLAAQSGRVDIFKILLKYDPLYVRNDEKTIFDCSPNEETTSELLKAIIKGSAENQDQLQQLIELELKKQHIHLVLPMLKAVSDPKFTINILNNILSIESDTPLFKSKAIQEKAKELLPLLSFLHECIGKYEVQIPSEEIDNFVNAIEQLAQTEDEQDYLMIKEYIEGATSKLKETVKIKEPTPSNTNPYQWFQPPSANAPVSTTESDKKISFSPGGNDDSHS
ncbi:TPA: ankyrin repeat domain-containing protein [Legionella anisa]|uniref:ankyrin repeat domain-containing protein n=1 Tax=Legionella anisa TaxID=28082 RepID=UPI00197F7294|nr:ankyrin repeat domain-containing protein [Legionella anisa]MBN5935531.1 ankyrin repeat domain-containing protein [Legionella anisa]